jgi:hypothetical protein
MDMSMVTASIFLVFIPVALGMKFCAMHPRLVNTVTVLLFLMAIVVITLPSVNSPWMMVMAVSSFFFLVGAIAEKICAPKHDISGALLPIALGIMIERSKRK